MTQHCLDRSFYQRSTQVVARELVGKRLVRIITKNNRRLRLAGIIVETEAYGHEDDPASHAYVGKTIRNSVMFGEVGRTYVYFTYGNHFCVNVSAHSPKQAGAVLLRGIAPEEGIEIMREFRPVDNDHCLTSGPGKLTQALNITSALNGTDMADSLSELHIEFAPVPKRIIATSRIGITRAMEKNWRFINCESHYISRRMTQIKV